MEGMHLRLGDGRFAKGNGAAEVKMVDVMTVNEIVIIADGADIGENLHLSAQFLPQFAADGIGQFLPRLHTASGGLDDGAVAE